jgi:isoleucyl-tRNA synthetase
VRYAAPILCFTAEEVWSTRYPDAGSVHLLEWPVIDALLGHPREGGDPAATSELDSRFRGNDKVGAKWERLRQFRSDINEAIEPLRRSKQLGSSLEAEVSIDPFVHGDRDLLAAADLAEIAIVSSVQIVDEAAIGTYDPGKASEARIEVRVTGKNKCGRCWRHLPEVKEDGALCARCEEVVHA